MKFGRKALDNLDTYEDNLSNLFHKQIVHMEKHTGIHSQPLNNIQDVIDVTGHNNEVNAIR